MQTIALVQNKNNNQFKLEYENGDFVTEDAEISFLKHNLYCFGRSEKGLSIIPTSRRGFSGSVLVGRELYSSAWLYYLEGDITFTAMDRLMADFNKSCDKDYKNKLIEKRIVLNEIIKLEKNTLLFKVSIGPNDKKIIINI
jgi:hypothetical protein